MPLTIRPCTPDDLPTLTAFLAELYRDIPQDAHLDELGSRLGEFSFVAENDGEIVGMLLAEKRSTNSLQNEIGRDAFPGAECYLEIQDVFVREEDRGDGVGAALVRTVLQRGKAAGIPRSLVYSANKDYVRIARFYERCGFNMWHIFMTHEGNV